MGIMGKVFCEKKGKYRAAFKTREKADSFIKNFDRHMEGVDVEFKPVRSFYCISCNMWHITHIPLMTESEWTEERDRKVQELQTLAERLKTEFRKSDWKVWKPIVEEGMELLESFRSREGFEKLVESTETQLQHCSDIIKTTEAKATGAADEGFKQIKKAIEQKMKALDFEGFKQYANELMMYTSYECLSKPLMTPYKKWLSQMKPCIEKECTMDTIRYIMKQASKSVPDSREVDAEELYHQVLSMTLCMDRLFIAGLPKDLWDILQSKVKKISRVLEHSFGSTLSPDGFPLMEKVRIVANESMLKDASEQISTGDKELTLEILQHLDTRMSQLPFSKKKVELMNRLCKIGERVFE